MKAALSGSDSGEPPVPSPSLSSTRPAPTSSRKSVALWLFACCALVFAMVVVGGVTRLTQSGLSIVEWQPIMGAVPPLDEAQWQETFEKYQQTPQFRLVNHQMTLPEFKGIFWWEYVHRLLGRLIGVAVFVPLLWFSWRRALDRKLAWRLAGIFILGALQGAMGWYMVKSGLVDDPHVSQYRLTAHLALAFAIYAAMLWTALDIVDVTPRSVAWPLRRLAWIVTALITYMVLTGGFVAGIRAGLAYNTFPLMNGHFVPPEILSIEPWYLNFFSNMATVQFDHRLGAWTLAFAVPALWLKARQLCAIRAVRRGADLVLCALVLQVTLGISTLLLAVPVPLAAAHQAGALLLFTAALCFNHLLRQARAS